VASVAQPVRAANAIVLAVPFDAVERRAKSRGSLQPTADRRYQPATHGNGRPRAVVGFDRFGAEHVASLVQGDVVFETLNRVSFELMANTAIHAAPPVMFVAGDDAAREYESRILISDLRFHAVNAGGLGPARLLEPDGMLRFTRPSDRRVAATTPLLIWRVVKSSGRSSQSGGSEGAAWRGPRPSPIQAIGHIGGG
jgi:8-hydroxy-5-deazaflavin:NADPH oxidoreductase